MKFLKELFYKMSHEGLHLPFVKDPVSEKPSVTLLSLYICFCFTVISLILLHFSSRLMIATGFTMMAWVLSYVMYRIRHLDKFRIDLDDQEIEFDASDDKD